MPSDLVRHGVAYHGREIREAHYGVTLERNRLFNVLCLRRTKHTAKLKFRLPGLVGELIEPIAVQRQAQAQKPQVYRETDLTERQVDHAIMQMYRDGVLNVQRIADVWNEWEKPTFEEIAERHNAWRRFNATTFALKGKVAENPSVTTRLHRVIDGICETIH
jgi:hypothetical protein